MSRANIEQWLSMEVLVSDDLGVSAGSIPSWLFVLRSLSVQIFILGIIISEIMQVPFLTQDLAISVSYFC